MYVRSGFAPGFELSASTDNEPFAPTFASHYMRYLIGWGYIEITPIARISVEAVSGNEHTQQLTPLKPHIYCF